MEHQALFSSKDKSKIKKMNKESSAAIFVWCFNSLTTKKQMTKFFVCNFSKNFKSKLYHFRNWKTRGQTV